MVEPHGSMVRMRKKPYKSTRLIYQHASNNNTVDQFMLTLSLVNAHSLSYAKPLDFECEETFKWNTGRSLAQNSSVSMAARGTLSCNLSAERFQKLGGAQDPLTSAVQTDHMFFHAYCFHAGGW